MYNRICNLFCDGGNCVLVFLDGENIDCIRFEKMDAKK